VPVQVGQNPVDTVIEDELNSDFTLEEMHEFMKHVKRGKACGMDRIIAELILDGEDLLHECLLNICIC